jgi:hypothetical protein
MPACSWEGVEDRVVHAGRALPAGIRILCFFLCFSFFSFLALVGFRPRALFGFRMDSTVLTSIGYAFWNPIVCTVCGFSVSPCFLGLFVRGRNHAI